MFSFFENSTLSRLCDKSCLMPFQTSVGCFRKSPLPLSYTPQPLVLSQDIPLTGVNKKTPFGEARTHIQFHFADLQGSAQGVPHHSQVVLLEVPQQDLSPPLQDLQQRPQPCSTSLALPQLLVPVQRLQQPVGQAARPQCGHSCLWEAEMMNRDGVCHQVH